MPTQLRFKTIFAVLILLAGISFNSTAQDDEKELKACESSLLPLKVAVAADEPFLPDLADQDLGLLHPSRARIMPAGSPPSFMFTALDRRLVAWPDDLEKLHVSYLESPLESLFTLSLEPGEVVHDFLSERESNRLKVETNRRVLTLEFNK
jgi:hypothetical protein